jgi:predicted TIM-barrel fold metal-dependent hydrolase
MQLTTSSSLGATAPIPVFDIDTHFTEPADLWTSQAPAKYKDKVFHVETKPNGAQAWYVEGREIGMIGPAVVDTRMQKHLHAYTLPRFDLMSRASIYGPERLDYMDSAGIGTQIIYPNIIGFGAQTLMRIGSDVELRLWHVQAYNNALVELQRTGKGRLLPQAALPLWDIDATLEELTRVRKLGLSGIAMSDKPADFGQPSLANQKWDRFFATCQDLGLPINFHIGSGTFEGEVNKWWPDDKTVVYPDQSLNGPLAAFSAVNNFMNNFLDVVNLILGGILEKYPRLKFVSVESGCGWLPFVLQALEHNWKEMMTPSDLRKFKRTPKEMFIDQIFASYWFEDSTCVDAYLAEFGNRNLMFQTDFPHPTSLYPDIQKKIQQTLAHRDLQTQENVLYKTAERVYGIPVYQATRQ